MRGDRRVTAVNMKKRSLGNHYIRTHGSREGRPHRRPPESTRLWQHTVTDPCTDPGPSRDRLQSHNARNGLGVPVAHTCRHTEHDDCTHVYTGTRAHTDTREVTRVLPLQGLAGARSRGQPPSRRGWGPRPKPQLGRQHVRQKSNGRTGVAPLRSHSLPPRGVKSLEHQIIRRTVRKTLWGHTAVAIQKVGGELGALTSPRRPRRRRRRCTTRSPRARP